MIMVGFELYCKLLEESVQKYKPSVPNDQKENTYLKNKSIYIPNWYIENPQERLIVYRRLINCKNAAEQKEIKIELLDRYGSLPKSLENIFL